jgi:hypothetical protein
MAPLVSGAESDGTNQSPGKLAASGRSLQTCNRDPARSQFALVRSDARRRLPARNQQRRFCRPAAGAVSDKSMFLELEEDHDVNPSTHNLGVHLRPCTASPGPFRRPSEGEGNKQVIWRPHAAVINHEDSDVSVCPTTQAQARNSDSATTEPTYARLYPTPSLESSSLRPHTPGLTLRFEDFVNVTPIELQAR